MPLSPQGQSRPGYRTPAAPVALAPDDPYWPALWRELTNPPAGVQVSGEPAVLGSPAVAIVGTRRATPRGLALARGLAARLALEGWTIVSGLAAGIDAAAHQGALHAGGLTVAVMATGIDLTYPWHHRALRSLIEAGGCCVTEFPGGTPPLKHHFPQRNRLIAGLVRGVIVVEAPRRSGALDTARRALDANREVFAVPGPVDLPSSRGCHALLKEGAHLVESAQDVVDVLGRPGPFSLAAALPWGRALQPAPGSSARWIFDRLDLEGVSRDDLRERWPGGEDTWQEGLLALEMADLIQRLPGGRLARRIWDDP